MKASTIRVDRTVVFVVAVALIAAGAATLLWRLEIGFARRAMKHADPTWYAEAPQQGWWDWAIGCGAIACLLAGVWLIVANVRPHRVGTVELAGTDALGTFTANVNQVGRAVAAMLARHQAVHSATATTVVDRGHRTLRLTIVAAPEITLEHLRRLAADSVADIDVALAGAEIAVQVFVRYLPAVHD